MQEALSVQRQPADMRGKHNVCVGVLYDMQALSHAINLLKREQAKLEAAQARADAARKRVIELEERENERERAAAAAAATAAAAAAEASSAAHTPQHSHLYGPAVSGAGDGGMGTRTAARNNQLHSQPHQLHYKSPLPAQPGTASSLQAPTPSSVYQGSHQGSMQPRAVEPELSDAVHGLAPVDDEDTAGTKRCETFKVCDNALWGTAEGRSSLGGAAVSHEVRHAAPYRRTRIHSCRQSCSVLLDVVPRPIACA